MDNSILPTFCHIHDVWPWAGHLTSLSLSPLLCIIGDNSIYLIVLFLMIKWIISNQVLKLRASLIAQLLKESACNAGDHSSIPCSRRTPGERIGYPLQDSWVILVAQMVRNPPIMWETWVQYLGWEDALEEGMATHCSILAWRIPWTEKPGGPWPMGLQESDMTEWQST